MEPNIYTLSRVGFSKEQIEEITGCEDKEMQIRMLRKGRFRLLDEIHEKQQSLDDWILGGKNSCNIVNCQKARRRSVF